MIPDWLRAYDPPTKDSLMNLPQPETMQSLRDRIAELEQERDGLKQDKDSFVTNPIAPTVGRMVYYVAYGTPGGEYKAGAERAATITQVNADGSVGLCIFNPTGLFFTPSVAYNEENKPGTWHWMPYQLGQAKAAT